MHAGCCRGAHASSTDLTCFCLCNGKNTSLGRYVDKHALKAWAAKHDDQSRPNVPMPVTYAYADSVDNFIDPHAIRMLSPLIFKATHLCGGVARVEPHAVTCLRPPCTRASGERFLGKLGTESVDATLDVLEQTCKTWLGMRYRGPGGNEGGLYRHATHGCMLEEAVAEDAADVDDLKVFCFSGTCAFAFVSVGRFGSSRNATLGRELFQADHRGFFTLPSWGQIRTAQPKERYPLLTDWKAPSFVDELYAHATNLARNFHFVRVDFISSDDEFYYLNELTFAPGGCEGGAFVPPGLEQLYGSLVANGVARDARQVEAQQHAIVAQYARTHSWRCPCWARVKHCCWR